MFFVCFVVSLKIYSPLRLLHENHEAPHCVVFPSLQLQGGSNMTGTDLCVNKPRCAAAVRPWESGATTSTLPPAWVRTCSVLFGIARVMSEQKVPRRVEQRIVIKFLVRENVPSAEIHHRLQQQYGEECLSRPRVFEWCKCFREGRERVENEPHDRRPRTSVVWMQLLVMKYLAEVVPIPVRFPFPTWVYGIFIGCVRTVSGRPAFTCAVGFPSYGDSVPIAINTSASGWRRPGKNCAYSRVAVPGRLLLIPRVKSMSQYSSCVYCTIIWSQLTPFCALRGFSIPKHALCIVVTNDTAGKNTSPFDCDVYLENQTALDMLNNIF
jgi:hypothetical protein